MDEPDWYESDFSEQDVTWTPWETWAGVVFGLGRAERDGEYVAVAKRPGKTEIWVGLKEEDAKECVEVLLAMEIESAPGPDSNLFDGISVHTSVATGRTYVMICDADMAVSLQPASDHESGVVDAAAHYLEAQLETLDEDDEDQRGILRDGLRMIGNVLRARYAASDDGRTAAKPLPDSTARRLNLSEADLQLVLAGRLWA